MEIKFSLRIDKEIVKDILTFIKMILWSIFQ